MTHGRTGVRMPVVIDGSALAEIVLRSDRAAAVESLVEGEDMVAPDLVGAEALSVVRGLLLRGLIDLATAERAVENVVNAPVRRLSTTTLLREMWSMYTNVTPYDAGYVAMARKLAAPLVTLDDRLARAAGLGIELRTLRAPP